MPKIVITGGPCAGKTTLMGLLAAAFVGKGREVVLVNECATELLAQGITPDSCGSALGFQRHVFNLQLEKEERLAGMSDDAVVLLDRGLMDNAGYLPEEDLNILLAEHNMTRADAYARYDAVVHLVTAAIGAEKFFSHETNEHRLEGVEEAVRVDEALRAGWAGHPNLQIIDNQGTFEDKLRRAVDSVTALVEEL